MKNRRGAIPANSAIIDEDVTRVPVVEHYGWSFRRESARVVCDCRIVSEETIFFLQHSPRRNSYEQTKIIIRLRVFK